MPAGHIAGIIWRSIQSSVGYERFLGIKAAHIPNFSYELRPQSRAYAEQIHDNGIFRQLGSQCLHFVFESRKRGRSRPELGYSLFHEQLGRFRFRYDVNVSAGLGVNGMRLCFTEVVAVLSAPTLVFVCECLLGFLTDAAAMPEFSHKVHPLLAAIGAGRTGKQAVCIRKSGVQQGDQVILQHGLNFGILLVLPVADFQHESGILLRDISRQGKPAVKTIVRQLYSILPVSLDTPQIIVPVAMHQLCIDNGNI